MLFRGWWIGCALAFCVVAQGFSFFEPVQPPRRVQVMAHRGVSGAAPVNSRAALTLCIEDGLEWAEIDVRLTKDGQHVVVHDAEVAGRKVAESTLAELQQIDIGSEFAARFAGERILSLAEAFALAKGKLNFYLDCKAIASEQLAREILAAGMERQTVIYDHPANLRKIDVAAGGMLALMTKFHGEPIKSWVASNHLAAVEIDADQVAAEVVQPFHELGVKVQVKCLGEWDNSTWWEKAMLAGADWIQTDFSEEVRAHDLWRRVKTRPVRFSLHRGAKRYAPENTLPAFEKAGRLGADFIEFDVRTTRDGKFFLLHNDTLEGHTTGHGPIADLDSAEVLKLSAGVKFVQRFAAVRLPTLDEFLSSVGATMELYFDAKAIPPEALAEAVARHKLSERTVVYQSVAYLKRLQAIDPRLRALPPLNDLNELDALARELKPYAVDANWSLLSKEMIARCHALGILVFSDALGAHERVEDYLQAIDWGIDLIQTDHPLRVMRAIELRAGKRSE